MSFSESQSQTIIKALLVLFVIKPAIDLTWNLPVVTVAGRPFSLLHIVGVFVFLYFGRYLFVFSRASATYSWLFKLFIALNLVSIFSTLFVETVPPIKIIDLLLRILDSYIIYNVAYFAAQNYTKDDSRNIVLAVSIGTFIALLLNFIVIKTGYGAVRLSSNMTYRQQGLYHDPGTLSNIAMYNIIFTSYFLHLRKSKNIAWYVYSALTVLMSLYLIYLGVSRSVFLLLAVYGIIYIGIFKKGAGKAIPVMFIGAALVIGSVAGLNYDIFAQRFSSEIQVFDTSEQIETKKDKDIDLGRFERLGSNRGQIIAYALDEISKRPLSQLLIGNFNSSSSHSDYIDVLARNGIIGILVYVALLFLIWKRTLGSVMARDREQLWPLRVMAFTMITLYILYSFPFRPLGYTTMSWYMWAVIGYTFGRLDMKTRSPDLVTRSQPVSDEDSTLPEPRILSYKQPSKSLNDSG